MFQAAKCQVRPAYTLLPFAVTLKQSGRQAFVLFGFFHCLHQGRRQNSLKTNMYTYNEEKDKTEPRTKVAVAANDHENDEVINRNPDVGMNQPPSRS